VTGMTTELLGTAAAAEAIGIERSTLSRWVASGRMTPHMQLAGRTGAMLFTRSEVDRVAAAYQANDAA